VIGLKSYRTLVEGWLKVIRIENGYQTDLGDSVSSKRKPANGDDRRFSTFVLIDGLNSVKKTPHRRDWEFDVVIEARLPTAADTAEDTIADVMEDIVRAIPTKTSISTEGLQTMEVVKADVLRQPDGVNYNVVGVTLRGTCFEFTTVPA